MYLRKYTDKRINKTYLSIARGYQNKDGKVRTAIVQHLGSLEELKKQYEDPIAHFKAVIQQMNLEEKNNNLPITINLDKSEQIPETDTPNRKNFGYAAFSKIYHELEINKFFESKFRDAKISNAKINNIMKLLVYSRILFPDSKKANYENKDMFFENSDFSLKDVYRALTHIEPLKDELQKYVYEHIQTQYDTNTECIYYDVTNYYFEIDEQDNMRKKGVSKEHRPNPIVQMGLFIDNKGFPMNYKLFSGNTNDCLTLRPMVQELQKNYDINKVIVVADKGLNTGNNIAYNIATGNGYVFSQSIRGANDELQQFVLDDKGYIKNGNDYKIKSRQYPRKITITKKDGTKVKKNIDEKQVIFWSADYAKRAKAERQPAIDKATQLINNVSKFNKANSHGASKYIKNLVFDKSTGEIIDNPKSKLSLDLDKISNEEKFDGYYAIVTSEYTKTDSEIIDIYRGLWRIEETFKVTKSDLESRPVFLSREEHIQAHFLTCYISLVLLRILQHRLEHKYSTTKIIENLGKVNCSHIQENYYLFDYTNQIIADIGLVTDIDFSRKYMTLQDIKKTLASTKKCST